MKRSGSSAIRRARAKMFNEPPFRFEGDHWTETALVRLVPIPLACSRYMD
jgi:hypothetical protein